MSHPTRDCPMKERGPTNDMILDSEYDSFLSELGSKAKESTVVTATTAAIQPKKQQTIIHLGTVMTGLVPPPATPWNAPLSVVPPPPPPILLPGQPNLYAGYIPPPVPAAPYYQIPSPPVPMPPPPKPVDPYATMNEMD